MPAGYEVQTVRIATRWLEGVSQEGGATAAELEGIASRLGVGFFNAGATSSLHHLKDGSISSLVQGTHFTSCSFLWQQEYGFGEALQLAKLILGISQATAGAGNFRFGVAFNCPPEIPFFPAARPGQRAGFALATENSALLYEAMDRAAKSGGGLEAAYTQLNQLMAAALVPLETLALQLERESGEPYVGIDASICPALERPNMAEAYERLLGPGRFGGPGTLAICERITAAIKALPLQRCCGYSGLMLPVCEDTGLAEAASEGRISVGSLLHFSSVCGCGLDTVPVPGVTASTPPAARQQLEQQIAAVLLDVAAMAYRLDKPLSCRLLPVPGGEAGDGTVFSSPYLVNCNIMAL
ncbi:hypothetical protein N2152v2_003844 [Parachlorella kessleri]